MCVDVGFEFLQRPLNEFIREWPYKFHVRGRTAYQVAPYARAHVTMPPTGDEPPFYVGARSRRESNVPPASRQIFIWLILDFVVHRYSGAELERIPL